MMKFSGAISRVKWLSGEDEDRDGLRNVGFFAAQPFDPAYIPRKLHHRLRVFENRVLRRIFGTKWGEAGKDCIMRRFITCKFLRIIRLI
jgi:hypothetical protein